MKTTFLILTLLLLSMGLNANPPDSCLWVPTQVFLQTVFSDKNTFNSDSTLYIDTCGIYANDPQLYLDTFGNITKYPSTGYNTYYVSRKRYYSRSIWGLKFDLPSIVFDTTNKDLNAISYFTINDLDVNKTEIVSSFQKVRNKYGEIKFWLNKDKNHTVKEIINSMYYIPGLFLIESENLVNSIEFAEFINDNVPNVHCSFSSIIIYPTTDLKEIKQINSTIRISSDYNKIEIANIEAINKVFIYSIEGMLLLENNNSFTSNSEIQFDISFLPTGVYFIRINNLFNKFIIAR